MIADLRGDQKKRAVGEAFSYILLIFRLYVLDQLFQKSFQFEDPNAKTAARAFLIFLKVSHRVNIKYEHPEEMFVQNENTNKRRRDDSHSDVAVNPAAQRARVDEATSARSPAREREELLHDVNVKEKIYKSILDVIKETVKSMSRPQNTHDMAVLKIELDTKQQEANDALKEFAEASKKCQDALMNAR